jgi:hypothetical protein
MDACGLGGCQVADRPCDLIGLAEPAQGLPVDHGLPGRSLVGLIGKNSLDPAAAYANPTRGWERPYINHVRQADTGVDLDFLVGSTGSEVGRESH